MSLTMLEHDVQDLEGQAYSWKEASERMKDQLHQHLTDMNELCSQVRSARDVDSEEDDVIRSLFDELIATLEQHKGMISGQLDELADHPPVVHPAHDAAWEVATCSR